MRLDSAQTDRAIGVLLGGACGDALGAGYEFGSAPLPPTGEAPAMIGGGLGGFDPGEWTDDTSMAFAIAEVAATGADLRVAEALDAIASGFRRWYDDGPADIGIQTSRVLGASGPDPTAAAMRTEAYALHVETGRTGGNGSLMRTGPVVLAHLDDADALAEAARKVSSLTHPDQRASEACVLWCLAIRHAVLTGELDVRAGLPLLGDAVGFWGDRLDEAEREYPRTFTPNGYVVTALQAAWSAIHHTREDAGRFERDHIDRALDRVIGIGDDTDTTAAIAGALLGAAYGSSAFPATWREILHGWPGRRASDLVELALLAVRGGRPDNHGWPSGDRVDYRGWDGEGTLARHPHDDGVWLAAASELDRLPEDVTAVVSLCRVGKVQVPAGLRHVEYRLLDTDAADNPNLEFVIDDAARTIQRWRDEGEVVLLHCVASQGRTPTVAARYAVRRGVPLEQALHEVCDALPAARPKSHLREAQRGLGEG